jgi:pyridoxamine 5'-phosphate oxidase
MLISIEDQLEEVFRKTTYELKRGALDRKHPFRFLSMATSDSEGIGLRYVVLREVDENLDLYIYTDQRSAKVGQIRANPAVSLLFYHPRKNVQIRVDGRAELHHNDELAARHWQKVGEFGRKSYGSKHAPGATINHPTEAYQWPEEIDSTHFTVIKLVPVKLETLQLGRSEHLRAQFDRTPEGWKKVWIAP